jgi:hypothetical protein
MQGWVRLAAAFTLLVASGCAAAIETGSFVDHDVDFTRYRSYKWAPASQQTGDPRLARNPIFQDRLQGEIDRQLQSRGLRGPVNRADLLVRLRSAVQPRAHVTTAPAMYGNCATDCTDRIREYESATLVVDLVDARTRQIVWRGWAQDDLRAVAGDPDRMARTVRSAVTGMMEGLPATVGTKGD